MRIDSATTPPAGPAQGAEQPKETVRIGDTVKPEVLSSEGGVLTLRTYAGTVFSARSARPLAALPGDTLRLTVTGRTGDVLLVERAGDAPTPREVLRQLGAVISERNVNLAAALTASRLPVSAQVWEALGKALSAYPELSPERAVFMLEYQVPVNRQNITQMGRTATQEHRLGRQLAQLEALLTDPPAQPAAQWPPAGALPADPARALNIENTPLPTAGAPARTFPVPQGETSASQMTDSPVPNCENQIVLKQATPSQAPPGAQTPVPSAPGPTQTPSTPPNPEIAAPLRPAVAPPDPGLSTFNPQFPTSPQPSAELPVASPSSAPKAPAVNHQLSIVNSPPDALTELRNRVSRLFRQVRTEQGELTLKGPDLPRTGRDIAETLRAVAEKVAELPQAQREQVLSLTRDIAESMRFAAQLDRFATVVQWPVLLDGRRAEAELYVFKDRKDQKKIDPQNATLFLSLTTAHLGRVETLARVIGKNVECDFRLEEQPLAHQLKGETDALRRLLDKCGFRLTRSSFDMQTEPAADPSAIAEIRDKFDKRYNFEAQI